MTEFAIPVAGLEDCRTEEECLQRIVVPGARPHEVAQVIADVRRGIARAFEGKTLVPRSGEQMLTFLHGAPGSGKTDQGYRQYTKQEPDDLEHCVFVAYDEHGMLEQIGGWQKESAGGKSYKERLAARDKYRHAAQVGRDLVLNRVLTEGYNAFIDTVGARPGIFRLMDAAETYGYRSEVLAWFAPWGISKERVLERRRAIAVEEELIAKRALALDTFPELAQRMLDQKSKLILFFNPDNSNSPQIAMGLREGRIAYKNNRKVNEIYVAAMNDLRDPDLKRNLAIRTGCHVFMNTMATLINTPVPASAMAPEPRGPA